MIAYLNRSFKLERLFLILFLCFQIYCYSVENPKIFLYLEDEAAINHANALENVNVEGAQIRYFWRSLELEQGKYDFSKIKADLDYLSSLQKKLFIQIQDRSFHPYDIPVPDYILKDIIYQNGIVIQFDFPGENRQIESGWVTKQWIPQVQQRFQALLVELAKNFDGKIYGINLPETSVDLDPKDANHQFTSEKYFNTILENMEALRKAFKKSHVVQYVNFIPGEWDNDQNYMGRIFEYAIQNNIGLGNPDIVPYRRGQMKNSYPFFHKYKGDLPLIAIAAQEGGYTYVNPDTKELFSMQEIAGFAKKYLGAHIVFWNIQEPQFTNQVLPLLNTNKLFVD